MNNTINLLKVCSASPWSAILESLSVSPYAGKSCQGKKVSIIIQLQANPQFQPKLQFLIHLHASIGRSLLKKYVGACLIREVFAKKMITKLAALIREEPAKETNKLLHGMPH